MIRKHSIQMNSHVKTINAILTNLIAALVHVLYFTRCTPHVDHHDDDHVAIDLDQGYQPGIPDPLI